MNDVQLRLMLSSAGPGNEDISSNFTLDLIQPEVNSLVSISQPAIRAVDIKYSLRTKLFNEMLGHGRDDIVTLGIGKVD